MILKFVKTSRAFKGALRAFVLIGLCLIAPSYSSETNTAPTETDLMEKQRTLEKDLEAQAWPL